MTAYYAPADRRPADRASIEQQMRSLVRAGAAVRRAGVHGHAHLANPPTAQEAEQMWWRHRALGQQRALLAACERARLLELRAVITTNAGVAAA